MIALLWRRLIAQKVHFQLRVRCWRCHAVKPPWVAFVYCESCRDYWRSETEAQRRQRLGMA